METTAPMRYYDSIYNGEKDLHFTKSCVAYVAHGDLQDSIILLGYHMKQKLMTS